MSILTFLLNLSLDVLVKIRKRHVPPFRPDVPKDVDGCDKRYTRLMQKCWDNEPSGRPTFTDIKLELKTMNNTK